MPDALAGAHRRAGGAAARLPGRDRDVGGEGVAAHGVGRARERLQELRSRRGGARRDALGRRPRVRRLRRPFGLRQVHPAQDDRRARGDHLGAAPDRRQADEPGARRRPRHRDGLSVLRALPAHDRGREHGLCTQNARRRQGRGRGEGTRRRGDAAADRPPRPQAAAAERRPAAARRHRPRHHAIAGGLPFRRAAQQPRR